MTYNIRKLEERDLIYLSKQEINKDIAQMIEKRMFNINLIASLEYSFSVFFKGDLLLCCGVTPYWFNRAQIWTIFSEDSKKNFLPVFRAMKFLLHYVPFKRLELCVPCDFELGKRRAKMFGFELECERAKSYLPTGEDQSLFAYVKED